MKYTKGDKLVCTIGRPNTGAWEEIFKGRIYTFIEYDEEGWLILEEAKSYFYNGKQGYNPTRFALYQPPVDEEDFL